MRRRLTCPRCLCHTCRRSPSVATERPGTRICQESACRVVAIWVAAALLLLAGCTRGVTAGSANIADAATSPAAGAPLGKPVYAYYYLWWSLQHWHELLGSQYPYSASPLPLPATLDAAGCHPTTRYAGNKLTDVPPALYSQDDPGFIEADVRQAQAAGLAGFIVNWAGTGSASQTTASNPYSKRLQYMVDAVHKVNAEGKPFHLWLSYKASAAVLPLATIQGDLSFFTAQWAADPALDQTNGKPTVIWQGSRKYSAANLQTISSGYRGKLRILGDESTWSTTRAPYLDGDAYYWSSQNPYANPQSFSQIKALATAVRASPANPDGTPAQFVAPAAPGFDTQLEGGTACTPRKGGQTITTLVNGNAPSNPDAWGVISWNEITEASYIDPMTRYGTTDLDALTRLIRGQ